MQAWNAARLARLQAAEHQQGVSSQYSLNFLWLDKQIGVAVDQVFKKVGLGCLPIHVLDMTGFKLLGFIFAACMICMAVD